MATLSRALLHAYLLAARGEIHGSRAVELGELLRSIWRAQGVLQPDAFDGVSVWVDDAGCARGVVVRDRAPCELADRAVLLGVHAAFIGAHRPRAA